MRTPPIGANKTPTMKNRGSTLLGVRIGLSEWSAHSSKAVEQGDRAVRLTAMLSTAAAEMQYLTKPSAESKGEGRVSECLLAGLRDLGFLSSASRACSCSSMDSVPVTSAWDIVGRMMDVNG